MQKILVSPGSAADAIGIAQAILMVPSHLRTALADSLIPILQSRRKVPTGPNHPFHEGATSLALTELWATVDMGTEKLYDHSMRCAIYACTMSTDPSCEMQLRELRKFISSCGWENAGEYMDTGFSWSKASRPALDRLMADAAQRQFDCLLVYKIDRFGRSVLHLNQQLAALTSYGVRFIATSQSLDTDPGSSTSRLLLHLLASLAECEREWIRERTRPGIRPAQAAGKVLGRPKRLFQHEDVVRLRDQEGLSWRAIGKKLGIPAMTALNSYRQSMRARAER